MTYHISVPNIHCSGCCQLLKLTLSDVFEKVEVDREGKAVTFMSMEDVGNVVTKLSQAFRELTPLGYTFENLQTI